MTARQKRRGESATDYVHRLDASVRIISNELAESAVRVGLEWSLAMNLLARDQDLAMGHLANAKAELRSSIPIQIRDIMSAAELALDALQGETEHRVEDADVKHVGGK